jgi:hypothetical protein
MAHIGLAVDKFRFNLDVPISVIAIIVAGAVVALGTFAYFYRETPPNLSVGQKGFDISQPRVAPPVPTPALPVIVAPAEAAPIKETIVPRIENAPMTDPPKPVKKRISFGYYYQWVRAQGDAGESQFVKVRKPCISRTKPKICSQPRSVRKMFILPSVS